MASLATTDTNNNNNDDNNNSSNNNGNISMPLPGLTRQLTGVFDNSSKDATYDFDDGFSSDTLLVNTNGNQNNSVNSSTGKATTPIKGNKSDTESLNFRWGGIKDEGVAGKENQDDFLVWESDDKNVILMCVLDGHGRELGRVASKAAKDAFLNTSLHHKLF